MIGVRIARRVTNAEVLGVEIKQPLPESAELLRLCDVLGVLDPDEAGLEQRSNLGEGVPPGQDVDDRPSGAHRASLPRALARCRQPAKRTVSCPRCPPSRRRPSADAGVPVASSSRPTPLHPRRKRPPTRPGPRTLARSRRGRSCPPGPL